MLTRGGAGRIGGADPGRVPASTWRPALGSGGAGHGILTAGVPAGIPLGNQIHDVTGAIGTVAKAPQKRACKAGAQARCVCYIIPEHPAL
jgi:hypothetical protein